jgi:peptide chain release factor subunit 1
LQELLRERDVFGILLIDASAATLATLQGRKLVILREMSSGVPGKTRAGGQSARRYERVREMRLQEYFRRVGKHADEAFLSLENFRGWIIGGPGPTKYDFDKGGYLNYVLKDQLLEIIDTGYVNEQGLEEIVEKAPEILRQIRYVEEKQLLQQFLYHVGHDTGLATYGETAVRRALTNGAVKTLLLTAGLDVTRVNVKCDVCGYKDHHTLARRRLASFEEDLSEKQCPQCTNSTLKINETEDLIENFAHLAEEANTDIEIISDETEEGQMLKKAFGGIAAILRYKY